MIAIKRYISIFLLVVMLLSSTAVFSSAAGASDGKLFFDSSDSLSYFSDPKNNLNISFNESEQAAKLTVTGGDPYININYSTISPGIKASDGAYFLLVYRTPSSNSQKAIKGEIFPCAGNIAGPTGGYSTLFDIEKSDEYRSVIINLSALSWWSGSIHMLRLDPFCNADAGDTMFVDTAALCKTEAEAKALAEERIELHTDTSWDKSSDWLCTAYGVTKYTSPLWKGNIVYNEAIYPISDEQGNAVYTLMYTPDKVLSLYTSNFGTRYTEGVDFTVSGNKITFLKTGGIPVKNYSDIHGSTNTSDYPHTAIGDGKYEKWGQSPEFFDGYLNITYTHSDTWKGPVPAQRSAELPRTAEKIKNNGDLNILYLGDSLTGGANSSSYRHVYPYAEWWNQQITSKLKNDLDVNVIADYKSIGGSSAPEMLKNDPIDPQKNYLDQLKACVAQKPDLLFIEYGANDAMNASQSSSYDASRLKNEYKNAIQGIIDLFRESVPNCEIVLVAPFYCNPRCHYMSYFDACRDALAELESQYSGVVMADITNMHKYLLTFKNYLDTNGDNMCHPNDFMSRVFSQLCLEAIVPGGIDAYVPTGPLPDAPQGSDTQSTYSYSAPDSNGWLWPASDAYGYISNYGTNGQDIIMQFDLSLLTANSEARLWIADGNNNPVDKHKDIVINTSSVTLDTSSAALKWGKPGIMNWHTVTITIKNGAGSVSIDGKEILSAASGIKAIENAQFLFSQQGSMCIDNISMRSSGGKVFFDCDFENESAAENLMGGGLGDLYKHNCCTVEYDLGGGSGEFLNQIKAADAEIELNDAVPEKAGCTFMGWSDSAQSNDVKYRPGAKYKGGTVTLYAVWQEDLPVIESITPQNHNIVDTGSVTYTMIASGDANMKYKWECTSGNAELFTMSGENSLALTVSIDSPLNESFEASFRCTATNSAGLSTASGEVTLTYTSTAAPVIEPIAPQSYTVIGSGSVVWTANADGEGLTYRWECTSGNADKLNLSGADSASLTVSADEPQSEDFTATFRCTVTNSNGKSSVSNEVSFVYEHESADPSFGDVSGDGNVDLKDKCYIKGIILFAFEVTEEEFKAADLNDDGRVDTRDSFILACIIAKVGKYV